MNATLIATAGGLVAGVGWGTGNFLVARSSKKNSTLVVNNALNIYGTVLVLIVVLFSGFKIPSLSQLLVMGAAEIFITTAYLIFIKAMSSGTLGIVVPLSSIYPVFVLLLTVAIIGAAFSGVQIVAMLVIVLGAAVLGYEKNHKQIPLKELHRESIMAVSAAVIWGVGFFILNYVINKLPWQTVIGTMYILGAALGLVFLIWVERRQTLRTIRTSLKSKSLLTAAPLLVFGSVGFYIGSNRAGSVVIPSVLAAGEPLVTSFWGAVIDKEKIGVLKRIGAVIIVAGIILLNLS